jgi:transposase InsO family protein
MAIEKELLDQLLAGRDPKDVFNKDGLVDELKKALSERILNTELDEHLDGEAVEGKGNRRNGYSKKSMLTGSSKMTLSVPRDRSGTFDPKLIAKYQRRFPDRRPRTTRPEPGHKIYPYLLRGMAITRPNQVWAMDITYIPMARGFVYLAVVLDWFSRRVLSWRVSITMEAAFCVETLGDALARHGKPDIFNTDQGSQFTGTTFTGVLIKNAIAISMDGKGAWRDNVFVERLWRSVKYEEVYLRAYDSVSEARASIGRYLDFYNGRRPHSSLDGMTPDQAYFIPLPLRTAA